MEKNSSKSKSPNNSLKGMQNPMINLFNLRDSNN